MSGVREEPGSAVCLLFLPLRLWAGPLRTVVLGSREGGCYVYITGIFISGALMSFDRRGVIF